MTAPGPVRAVLFDFAGTLFGRRRGTGWLGLGGPDEELIVRTLRHPDPVLPLMTADQRALWNGRDLSPGHNRAAYTTLFRLAGLRDEAALARVHRRLADPATWHPYPDTAATLRHLVARGLAIGVVSNISWDISRAFAAHELDALVGEFTLSYREGRCKPDPELFRRACERLGVPPGACLMVGDDPTTDGGATAVRMPFHHIAPAPVDDRPDALRRMLAERAL
ncbi:HAD family hydrolase [Streptomyces litchfieldiae]|uniref:HAD family hydrolase n=1 Tax=Streptomyces litchfieldiae TaxID=3075543 RepID=A0ABU2N129_9ACTN|nr:HAD family hydrolase [Streptomyces sp. DSM 44938]MDT0347218.1 HAD family hydrolase [Streptomyces sp. DSM 44938]